MKAPTRHRFLVVILIALALHLAAFAVILCASTFPAASPRASTAALSQACAASLAERESPARPACNAEPTAPFDVPSASICNPAIAGSRVSSGPGVSLFTPVKQSGARHTAPTLPVVAGLIFTRAQTHNV